MNKLILIIAIVFSGILAQAQTKSDVKIKMINYDITSSYVTIKVKVTNNSQYHITRCQATCILLDDNENELTFSKHYVIKGADGGLDGKDYTYFTYVINTPSKTPSKVKFKVNTVSK